MITIIYVFEKRFNTFWLEKKPYLELYVTLEMVSYSTDK